MKTICRIFGLSILFVLSFFVVMEFTSYNVRRNELNTCLTSAMTSTQIIMRENIEDEVFKTNTARKQIDSNAAYIEEFANRFYVLPTTNTDYTIDVLSVDYTKGLIRVRVNGDFKMLNGETKTISLEKMSIVDIIDKEN